MLIAKNEEKEQRSANGLIVQLTPSDIDIAFIIQECDTNEDGNIDRSELLPALATWAHVAEGKLEAGRMKGCYCLIS